VFENRVVLITGAASGIGLGIAQQFVEQGATVVGADLSHQGLQAAKDELGDRFIPSISDVRNEQQTTRLAAFVENTFHKLDCLINCAGVIHLVGPEAVSEADFYSVFDVHVKGPMLMVKHLARLLRRSSNPSIVNISSSAENNEAPLNALYGSAKAALGKFTRHMVRDLPGIRSNAVLPGWVFTPMTVQLGLETEDAGWWHEQVKPKVPCGRVGRPEDIANLVLFLCSEKATYINGASIVIDGGYTIAAVDTTGGPQDYESPE
jgi:3-oxoacyl-[acyl-carrier protein] reductase